MLGKVARLLRTHEGRDSVFTTLTEGLSMLGMVLVYKLAVLHSKQDLDLYVIVRRTIAFAFPVVLVGTMVGLTRFVSMSADPAVQRRYLRGALTWVLPIGATLMLTCLLIPGPLAWTVFGTYADAPLIAPLALMTIGIAVHGVAYGYLRGRRMMVWANTIQLLALAIAPCLAFVLFNDLAQVLWFTGAEWTGVAFLAMLPALISKSGSSKRERGELMRYGLPRVPGDIALGALLTVPGYVALRTYGIDLSGDVGFGATLLNLAAAVFSPVALLLLPAASAKLAAGDHAGLAVSIRRMTWIILAASLALTIGFELLAGPFLRIYLGPTGDEYVWMSRLIFLGALPFAFFNGMRSVLDAYFHTPRNGVNLVVSFLILMLGSAVHLFIATPAYTMGVVLVIALSYLGYATWRDVRFVTSELDRLAQRGARDINVVVVIPDLEQSEAFADSRSQAKAFIDLGANVSFFHLESRTSFMRLIASRQRLKKRLRDHRPDVVHVHFGSVAALFTVFSSSAPVVVTFMGDDLDRSSVRGIARPFVGGLFSQIAAFFAAGLICTDENVREHLWWRSAEAKVVPLHGDASRNAEAALEHLRAVAFHRTIASEAA